MRHGEEHKLAKNRLVRGLRGCHGLQVLLQVAVIRARPVPPRRAVSLNLQVQ